VPIAYNCAVRDACRSAFVLAALLAGAAFASCRTEKPAPPLDESSTPSTTLRPLSSRDRVPAPEDASAPTSGASLPPGHPPIEGGTGSVSREGAAAEGPSVAGTITVAPTLKAKATGSVLFVIARAGADRHIVAVRREDNVTFPLKFRISGADAMTTGTTFAGPLEITARLSKSGDAVASKGDVEGTAKGVAVPASDVKVVLYSVRE